LYKDTLYWVDRPTYDEYDNAPYKFYYQYDSTGQYLGKSEKFPRDGKWISFYKDLPYQVASTFSVKDSMITGTSIQYYPNGKKESVYELYRGIDAGFVKYWNQEGILISESQYEYDTSNFFPSSSRIGEWKEWDNSGKLLTLEHYKTGEKHGIQISYYPTGQVKSQTYYNLGQIDGTATEYHPNGEVMEIGNYDNGQRINDSISYEYHPNKSIAAAGRILNENKIDGWTYYYPNGNIKSKGNYCLYPLYHSHGVLYKSVETDQWNYWYPDEKLKAVVTYNSQGEIIEQIYYDQQGLKIDKNTFDQLKETIEN
jgi:antitoxin component YwqK of YwqJK toxin-antitoxin module